MTRFKGKTALITGGSTGIGFATAKLLISEGGRVAITGRDAKALEIARTELGANASAIQSDTSKLADIDALVSKLKTEFGALDLVFANAGIAKFSPFTSVDEAAFDETFNINVKGLYFTLQKAAPLLRDGGSIVVNTSVVDVKGFPATSVYSASKAAVRSLARTFATELVERKIRVNAVSPGPIHTPIYNKLGLKPEERDGFAAQMEQGNPMKRFGTADEVARAVLFLALDATYTTGTELNVDGGLAQL